MSSLSFTHCSCCNESFPSLKLTSGDSVCSCCSRDKQEPKLYSAANNMDPGSVPLALQGLMQVEEMLISPMMPIIGIMGEINALTLLVARSYGLLKQVFKHINSYIVWVCIRQLCCLNYLDNTAV